MEASQVAGCGHTVQTLNFEIKFCGLPTKQYHRFIKRFLYHQILKEKKKWSESVIGPTNYRTVT